MPFWIFRNNEFVVTPIFDQGDYCERVWNKPPLAIESLFHWICAKLFYWATAREYRGED